MQVILTDSSRTVFALVAEDILLEDEKGAGLPLGLDLIRLKCLKIDHNYSVLRDKRRPVPRISLLLFLLGIFYLDRNSRSNYLAIP